MHHVNEMRPTDLAEQIRDTRDDGATMEIGWLIGLLVEQDFIPPMTTASSHLPLSKPLRSITRGVPT